MLGKSNEISGRVQAGCTSVAESIYRENVMFKECSIFINEILLFT